MNTNNKWENININNFSGSIELLWELAKHNNMYKLCATGFRVNLKSGKEILEQSLKEL